jgi:2-oxoisovalerate dehydrogenase E2 component (dihydrolipoyl transacylase)
MTIREFALPDLGEGLTESELVEWHIAVGDVITLNQPIAEVETAKAIVQLPSPFAGTVSRLYAEPGMTVSVGAPLVAIDVPAEADDEVTPGDTAGDAAGDAAGEVVVASGRNSVLVGYGPRVETGNRPRRRERSHTEPPPRSQTPARAEVVPVAEPVRAAERPRSTPPVRKLAHDLGVDLTGLAGSGDAGLITRDDVLAVTRVAGGAAPTETAPAGGRETRVPIKGVRKHTAAAMVASAFTAPHVTVFLTVDVTPTRELLDRLRADRAFAGTKLTLLTIVAKALCIAVGNHPAVNSRWDEPAGQIVQFGYVNLGIAVATPRGLMVPNIPDADALSLTQLATAIGELADTARAGATTPGRLSGGTISISNVGVFGVDAGTPILNPGEAAILAIGAVRRMPWEHRGEIALRDVMTLSLSFDHRLVDGEQGARFLADIGAILAEPGMALTMV